MISHSRFEPGSSRTQTHFEGYSFNLLCLECVCVNMLCSYEKGYSVYIARPIGTCVRMRVKDNKVGRVRCTVQTGQREQLTNTSSRILADTCK
jgi:hypothetical protein